MSLATSSVRILAACVFVAGVLIQGSAHGPGPDRERTDFARDVQPVFKAHCLSCHNSDSNAGGLALDTYEHVMKGGASGSVVVPGKSGESLLVDRILGKGGRERMPLGFAPLSEAKVKAITDWIDEGAPPPTSTAAVRHWAFVAPVRPSVPRTTDQNWARNPVDSFVLARLEKEGLRPSPEADRTTLVRRLTLDLTGLPPTPAEVDAYLRDKSPGAYEKLVDRLLRSPHYGERMTLPWLDAARYADSNGFQQDGDTFQYVWRDWVVRAFNDDMPFDGFTVDQIAGDLLPHPTPDQVVATAFNRNHMLNGEGGAIPEEQRNVILFDRVDVTATTFLGLTMACARCHDHKYDPVSQRDFYSWMAFFNNVPESGVPSGSGQYRVADPWVFAGSPGEMKSLTSAQTEVAAAERAVKDEAASPKTLAAFVQWKERVRSASEVQAKAPLSAGPWTLFGPYPAPDFDKAFDTAFPPESAPSTVTGTVRPDLTDGVVQRLDGDNTAFYLARTLTLSQPRKVLLSFGSDDAIKVWLNGKAVASRKVTRGAALDQELLVADLHAGKNELKLKIVNGGGIGGFVFKANRTFVPDAIAEAVTDGPKTQEAEKNIRDYFESTSPPASLKSAREKLAGATATLETVKAKTPRVMVMSDSKPRTTHVLSRGNYESPLEAVAPDVPAFLPRPKAPPTNRLGLARWIVSPDNPLTARVEVNRIWQALFGKGLVATPENFGVQGETPSHPELLDWLAVEFRESGWRVKRLVKTIVMSATYRQSSRLRPELSERDPANRLLARGSRFRLPSLLLRDVALAASGLLDRRIGGKPVYPYQPADIWDGLAITKERDFTYPQSTGPDLYRRSLYTFWRRTVAPGNMFDAASRQACTVRASVTSTPMHALTTLNDVTWVEAGRVLAEKAMKASKLPRQRMSDAFRRVCARTPDPQELKVLERALDRSLAGFRASPKDALAYLAQGETPRDPKLDPAEAAAYASVCLLIFNLDEALTRE